MPDRQRHDPSYGLETALDRHWDHVLGIAAVGAEGELDPELMATVRRVRALDAAPEPRPDFSAMLWHDLLQEHARPTEAPIPAATAPAAPLEHARPRRPFAPLASWAPPRSPSRLAAAILLGALAVGSLLTALYPRWSDGNQRLHLIAPQVEETAEAGIQTNQLLDITFPEISGDSAWVEVMRNTIPPGITLAGIRAGATGPVVHFVEEGELMLIAGETAQAIRIIRAGGAGPEEELRSGETSQLTAGDAFVVPEQGIADLMNQSTNPAMSLLLMESIGVGIPTNPSITYDTLGGSARNLSAPLTLSLSRITLAPDATLSGEDSPLIERFVAPVNLDRVMDMRTGRNGSIRNAGDVPLDAYVLTLTRDVDAGPAASATPAPH